MKFQCVRYFLAMLEERNFGRAAKRCGVSQPSVTNAIKGLESEVGGILFVRGRSETLPTDLALAIKPHLEQALAGVEQVKKIAVKFQERSASRANSPISAAAGQPEPS
jgi:LysR family transcriptional regulator, hydrogen peroxide-inducible genes activator